LSAGSEDDNDDENESDWRAPLKKVSLWGEAVRRYRSEQSGG
jgi:hypothetical protein